VPADDGLRLHDENVRQPCQKRRRTAQKNLSSRFKMGRGRLRFSTVTCLSEGEDFESRITPTAKGSSECEKEYED
jgi:hypothetical protein